MNITNYEGVLCLSGGFDSTNVAYNLLKNNPDKRYLFIHIIMVQSKERYIYENEAVKKILAEFKKDGLINFDLKTCKIDSGTVGMIKDIENCGWALGIALRNPKYNIDKIYFCGSKEDFEQGPDFYVRYNRRLDIIKAITSKTEFTIVEPNRNTPREDVIKSLPQKYRELVWFCRTPTYQGKPCEYCHTCKQTLQYL